MKREEREKLEKEKNWNLEETEWYWKKREETEINRKKQEETVRNSKKL